MIVDAISPLGARLLDTKRTWETAGASRTRKMSIRATHSAAYIAEMGDEAESGDSSGSASQDADDAPSNVAEKGVGNFATATRSVSRQVTTLAGVEDAYGSN